MSTILPIGFVPLDEAIETIEHVSSAGKPDRFEVVQLRAQLAHDIGDGISLSKANATLWEAIDEGSLRLVAFGGHPRRAIKLSPEFTRTIPLLRRTRSFSYLRPTNRQWEQVSGWFGTDLTTVRLAVRETELKKLTLRLRRRRQRKRTQRKKEGRPSTQQSVRHVVQVIIERKQWSTKRTLKALTLLVNRNRATSKAVSEDTVTRALDSLHRTTRDRRYARVRRRLTKD